MNDYPYAKDPIDTADPWGYGKRECVSFTAWRLQQFDTYNKFLGNANTWPTRAESHGLTVDSTPAINSVVCLPPFIGGAGALGHVAWIVEIGVEFIVEDYNWGDTHDYLNHLLYRDSRYLYIHPKTLVTNKDDDMGASFVLPDNSQQARFWIGPDNHIYESWYVSSTGVWTGPAQLSIAGQVAGGLSASVTPDGSTQLLFWRGMDGGQYEAWYTNSKWNGPIKIPGT